MAGNRKSRLERKQVELAVPALLMYVEKTKAKDSHLLNENETIWMQLALKKIPQADKKPKRIPLPTSLYSNTTDICLFSKDKGSVVKEQLKQKGVTAITKVLSIQKVRKNYKSFESRRQLLAMYDLFLCDNRIYHLLPKVLGKEFFRKKKFPLPVDLRKTKLSEEIDKALQCTLIEVGHGPCSSIRIAHTGMSNEKIVVNIMEAVKEIAKIIPRGWTNIQSLNIKTSKSIALPIHTSMPDSIEVISKEPAKKKRKVEQEVKEKEKDEEEEEESD